MKVPTASDTQMLDLFAIPPDFDVMKSSQDLGEIKQRALGRALCTPAICAVAKL